MVHVVPIEITEFEVKSKAFSSQPPSGSCRTSSKKNGNGNGDKTSADSAEPFHAARLVEDELIEHILDTGLISEGAAGKEGGKDGDNNGKGGRGGGSGGAGAAAGAGGDVGVDVQDCGALEDNSSNGSVVNEEPGGEAEIDCRKSSINLLSFVYVWGITFIYLLIGAWIFQLLETEAEVKRIQLRRTLIEQGRSQLAQTILNDLNHNLTNCKNKNPSLALSTNSTSTNINIILAAISKYESTLDQLTNGQLRIYLDRAPIQTIAGANWGVYSHSYFFVITLITTIGYGNITPSTPWGRVFCIGYAIIGIPLMLVTIAKSGRALADICTHLYSRLIAKRFQWKYLSNPKGENRSNMQMVVGTSLSVSGYLTFLFFYMGVGGALYSYTEDWEFLNSFYFCFITLTTVGFGDLTPKIESKNALFSIIRSMYIVVGLALTSTAIELVRKQYTNWRRPWTQRKKLEIEQRASAVSAGRKRKCAAIDPTITGTSGQFVKQLTKL